jgi:hypothetical protein
MRQQIERVAAWTGALAFSFGCWFGMYALMAWVVLR